VAHVATLRSILKTTGFGRNNCLVTQLSLTVSAGARFGGGQKGSRQTGFNIIKVVILSIIVRIFKLERFFALVLYLMERPGAYHPFE
jgi:hypothetical protein